LVCLPRRGLLYTQARKKKARNARVQSDFLEIRNALVQLELDTGQLPGHLNPEPCVQNPETYLDQNAAGLVNTDGNFPNWSGPYFKGTGRDPWGNSYLFDPDYQCKTGALGCENFTNDTWVRAITSGGPSGGGAYDADNIVMVLCSP